MVKKIKEEKRKIFKMTEDQKILLKTIEIIEDIGSKSVCSESMKDIVVNELIALVFRLFQENNPGYPAKKYSLSMDRKKYLVEVSKQCTTK